MSDMLVMSENGIDNSRKKSRQSSHIMTINRNHPFIHPSSLIHYISHVQPLNVQHCMVFHQTLWFDFFFFRSFWTTLTSCHMNKEESSKSIVTGTLIVNGKHSLNISPYTSVSLWNFININFYVPIVLKRNSIPGYTSRSICVLLLIAICRPNICGVRKC